MTIRYFVACVLTVPVIAPLLFVDVFWSHRWPEQWVHALGDWLDAQVNR
jgi:hypothetical protein